MYRFGAEEQEAARAVLESGRLFRYMEGADQVDLLEREIAQKLGSGHSLATSSGTGALISALGAVGVGPGEEVLIPAYAYVADVLAVLAVGAVPVVCEVDGGLGLDPDEIAAKTGERTRAVMPVHMCGMPGQMDRIVEEARRHGLSVVEDSCQAFGGTFRGTPLGTFGDVGAFSFNQAKILTAGEGGALVTNDERLYQRAFLMHDVSSIFDGREPGVEPFAGSAFRMNELSGAILRAQLNRLDGILSELRTVAGRLRDALAPVPGVELVRSADPDGECGTNIAVTLPDEKAATALADGVNQLGEGERVWAMRGIALGHSFFEWEILHRRQGGHHDRSNPLLHHPRVQQPDELPRSKDLLGRTVLLGYSLDVPEQTVDRIVRVAESV